MSKDKKRVPLRNPGKIIYFISAITLPLSFISSVVFRFSLYHFFIEKNEDVIAFSAPEHIFYLLSSCFLFLLLINGVVFLAEKTANWLYKREVFSKNQKINSLCSRFAEKRDLKKLSKNKLKKLTASASIPVIIVFGVIISAFTVGGYISRWEITEDALIKYNAFNQVEEAYEYDFVDSYNIRCYLKNILRRGHKRHSTISLDLNLKDGRKIKFEDANIRDAYSGIIKLDSAFDGMDIPKETENECLDLYIEYNNISGEKEEMLRSVFGE